MCLLIQLTGAFPPLEVLKVGEERNRDGIGIAYVSKNGKVFYEKGITMKRLLEYKDTVTHGLIHFRMASIGPASKALCHPFPVGTNTNLKLTGEVEGVLAHNGHWAEWNTVLLNNLNHARLPQGHYSDTRAMAFLAGIHGPAFLELIEEKVVLITPKRTFRFGYGWVKREGYIMSNDPLYVPKQLGSLLGNTVTRLTEESYCQNTTDWFNRHKATQDYQDRIASSRLLPVLYNEEGSD